MHRYLYYLQLFLVGNMPGEASKVWGKLFAARLSWLAILMHLDYRNLIIIIRQNRFPSSVLPPTIILDFLYL